MVEDDGRQEDVGDEDHGGADTPAGEGGNSLAVSSPHHSAGWQADELEKRAREEG